MLRKLSRYCHDFIFHCQQSFAITKEDKESCFDIFFNYQHFPRGYCASRPSNRRSFSEPTNARDENFITRRGCMIIVNICELILARQPEHGLN